MEDTKLNKQILLVDDDSEWLEMVKIYLNGLDLQILSAHDGVEAELLLLKNPFDLAVLDTNMPRMNGIELLRIMRILYPTLPVILFFSGLAGSSITAREVFKMGANAVLEKAQAQIHLRPLVVNLLSIQDLKNSALSKISWAIHQIFAMPPEGIRG